MSEGRGYGGVDLLRLVAQLALQRRPWPRRTVIPQQVPVASAGLLATFIGHSTVLLQIDGVTVLTDPVFSTRASPVEGIGPRRARDPGVRLQDLPLVDLVLVSHDHHDHLDPPTLRALRRLGHRPAVLCPTGCERLIRRRSGLTDVRGLRHGQTTLAAGLRVRFLPTVHGSGRWLHDQMRTPWGAYLVSGPRRQVYFAGDSAYGAHLAAAGAEFGPIDLALLPIGAYAPRWFMRHVHMNPAEAVRAHRDLHAAASVAIHHGTFQLTLEGIDEPLAGLRAARRAQGVGEEEFVALEFGETRHFSRRRATEGPREAR